MILIWNTPPVAKLFEVLKLFGQSTASPEQSWINFKEFFLFWAHMRLTDILSFCRLAEVELNMPRIYVNTLDNICKTLSPVSGTEEQMWLAGSRDFVHLSGKILGSAASLPGLEFQSCPLPIARPAVSYWSPLCFTLFRGKMETVVYQFYTIVATIKWD